MKVIRVTMPDGSKWDVKHHLVVLLRATHYAYTAKGIKPGRYHSDEFEEEYEYGMKNPNELVDWAVNNLNWKDVSTIAKLVVDSSEPDYQEGWMNGPKEVLDIQ
jgi:hypothetical protein